MEQQQFRVSIKVAAGFILFCLGTVGCAAAWAQNVTNHLNNIDTTLVETKAALQDIQKLNVIQERTSRMEERLQHLEDWRLQEAARGR